MTPTLCRSSIRLAVLPILALCALSACRGGIKKQPPVHPVLDMDFQQKIKAQSAFRFAGWKDGRGMRPPVPGTVARGALDTVDLERFKDADGNYVSNPLPASYANLMRGRERFNIFCAVCHSRSGDLPGVVIQRAGQGVFTQPPKLSVPPPPDGSELDPREKQMLESADGYIFETIAAGRNTMPAYAHQIPVEDRWKIVHYVRALQARFSR